MYRETTSRKQREPVSKRLGRHGGKLTKSPRASQSRKQLRENKKGREYNRMLRSLLR